MQKGCTNGEYFCIINPKDINMKKIILSVLFAASCIIASAQSKTDLQQNTQLDTTAVYLLQRISQHTAPCYKLYKTEYKIRSITTQAHGQKSSSFFGASPPKNAKNLIKIARARTSAASVFGALPPRRGQEGQKGARRPSVSEHMHPLL